MADVIHLREFQSERRRTADRHTYHQSLERAVQIMKQSLAATADQLIDAPPQEQAELLERVERLTAMIRYGIRMIGDVPAGGDDARDTV